MFDSSFFPRVLCVKLLVLICEKGSISDGGVNFSASIFLPLSRSCRYMQPRRTDERLAFDWLPLGVSENCVQTRDCKWDGRVNRVVRLVGEAGMCQSNEA